MDYQNLKLIIKLHPLENKSLFKEYARINCIENISFAEENQSLFSLGKNASVIVTSNETQAFIDLIFYNYRLKYRILPNNNMKKLSCPFIPLVRI